MRILLQRVTEARVEVEGQTVGQIGGGLLLLAGVGPGDGQPQADRLAEKIANLRIFSDAQGKFNLSLLDVGGGALVVSQFTLYADARKGRRPSFSDAAAPDLARPLVDYLCQRLKDLGVVAVASGSFGAHMRVHLVNDGPVTIWLDSADLC